MNVYEFLYILQYIVAIGAMGYTIYNLIGISKFKKDENGAKVPEYSLRGAFLSFFAYVVSYFTGFVISLYKFETLLYMTLTRLEAMGLALMTILLLIGLFVQMSKAPSQIRDRYVPGQRRD